MTDTNAPTSTPTDAELIHAAEESLQALHTFANETEDADLNDLLTTHHENLNACLNRYNDVYAPAGEAVALRSGGGKEGGRAAPAEEAKGEAEGDDGEEA